MTRRFWSEMEIEHLIALDGVRTCEVAEILGRSQQSVYRMRRKLASGRQIEIVDCWSDDEDQFLRSTPHFTAEQQARHLGRAKTAVDKRREIVARKFKVKFSGDCDPHSVGSRRLLARTCIGCGLLLDANWFGSRARSKGTARSWNNRCTRCRDRCAPDKTLRDYSKSPAQKKAFHQRMQRITSERAVNHRQPWLVKDHAVLRDSSLSVFEKAIKLGRTFASVASACSENGYTSRVGKGDPANGVWHIENPNALAYGVSA